MLGDKSLIIFCFSIIAVGVLALVTITLTKKRAPRFDKEAYQVDFLSMSDSSRTGARK